MDPRRTPQSPAEPSERPPQSPPRDPAEPSERQSSSESLADGRAPRMVTLPKILEKGIEGFGSLLGIRSENDPDQPCAERSIPLSASCQRHLDDNSDRILRVGGEGVVRAVRVQSGFGVDFSL